MNVSNNLANTVNQQYQDRITENQKQEKLLEANKTLSDIEKAMQNQNADPTKLQQLVEHMQSLLADLQSLINDSDSASGELTDLEAAFTAMAQQSGILSDLDGSNTNLRALLNDALAGASPETQSMFQEYAGLAKSDPSGLTSVLNSFQSTSMLGSSNSNVAVKNIYYAIMLILFSMYADTSEIAAMQGNSLTANTGAAKEALYAKNNLYMGINQIANNSQLAALFTSGGAHSNYPDTIFNRIAVLESYTSSTIPSGLEQVYASWQRAKKFMEENNADFSKISFEMQQDSSNSVWTTDNPWSNSNEALFLEQCNIAVVKLNGLFSENDVDSSSLLDQFNTSQSLTSSAASDLCSTNVTATENISTGLNTINTTLKTGFQLTTDNLQGIISLLSTMVNNYKSSITQ